jgi:hypothetical protein
MGVGFTFEVNRPPLASALVATELCDLSPVRPDLKVRSALYARYRPHTERYMLFFLYVNGPMDLRRNVIDGIREVFPDADLGVRRIGSHARSSSIG